MLHGVTSDLQINDYHQLHVNEMCSVYCKIGERLEDKRLYCMKTCLVCFYTSCIDRSLPDLSILKQTWS